MSNPTITVDLRKLFDLFGLAAAYQQVSEEPHTFDRVAIMLQVVGMDSSKIEELLNYFGPLVLTEEIEALLNEQENV